MHESSLLTGPLEPTNEPYAVAKLAGIMLCRAYRAQYGAPYVCAIPANAFGPGDDFSPEDSHVVAAILKRMHEAQERGEPAVAVWGTGSPRRDFIFADDLADGLVLVMEAYDGAEPINIGSGTGISIAEVARAAKEVTGYRGVIDFDTSKPDGMPVKILDTRKINALGWRPRVSFREALQRTYAWYRSTVDAAPVREE